MTMIKVLILICTFINLGSSDDRVICFSCAHSSVSNLVHKISRAAGYKFMLSGDTSCSDENMNYNIECRGECIATKITHINEGYDNQEGIFYGCAADMIKKYHSVGKDGRKQFQTTEDRVLSYTERVILNHFLCSQDLCNNPRIDVQYGNGS